MKTLPFILAIAIFGLTGCVQPPWTDDSRVFGSSAYESSPYSTGYYPERRTSFGGYVGSSYSYYDRGYGSPYDHGGYYGSRNDCEDDKDHKHSSSNSSHSSSSNHKSSGSSSRSNNSRSSSHQSKEDSHPTRANPSRSKDETRQSRGRT